MTEDVIEVEDDDRAVLEATVAELVAALSEASDAPTEFDAPGSAFAPAAVQFDTQDWMSSVAAVQGWLRLPYELPLDDPKSFTEALARGLGLDEAEAATDGGHAWLSDVALDRLRERVERALQFQQLFLEELEAEGSSLTAATSRWVEAWEDEPEEDSTSGPVSAMAAVWPINEFSDRAARGKLNLSPSYQRGDVWPTSDSQMLIESILRGIPLPSVIVLKPHEQQTDSPYEVVDGKQRLTAILRFIGQHPVALDLVKAADAKYAGKGLRTLFETDYPKFRHAWKNLTGEALTATSEREYYFPFKLRKGAASLQGELEALQGKYYTQIKDEVVQVADDKVEVRELFERVTPYKIPVIEYSRATRRQIHEVFNLYNRQGKHLNAEEIRNALYHDLDFMRGLIVAAGDNKDVATVAPFIVPIWQDLSDLPGLLDDYGFGSSRYRRTKVLSWLASMLLVDSLENGRPKRQSTSRQIDTLLQRIESAANDPLRDQARIVDAFRLMLQAVSAHSAVDEAWSPRFKDTAKGAKWQELQLIASVLGVALAASVLGPATEERLAERAAEVRTQTSTQEWQRPSKTQTATQWDYISAISIRVLQLLGVEPSSASEALKRRFGYSSVETLQAVITSDRTL